MKMTMKLSKTIFAMICGALLISAASCSKKNNDTQIAVFVPGILADSPIYSTMADGVTSSVDEWNASNTPHCTLTISEAGTNQAQWGPLLTALAAEGKYDLIISSSPSIPTLVLPITKQFPNQKFILLDGEMTDCPTVVSRHFAQNEQSYLAGYAAALASKTGKLALIAAQEYPIMNDVILPGYTKGAKAARADAHVEFRVVGNWYDATKGAEITRALAETGVDVILPITGGARAGVISSAREHGLRLVLFDSADFDKAPDLIAACAIVDQERIAGEMTNRFLEGDAPWGSSETLNAKDGYVQIVLSQDENLVTPQMREAINDIASRMMKGGSW